MKTAKPNQKPCKPKKGKRTGRLWQRFPGIMRRGMQNSPYYPILHGIVYPMLKKHPGFKGIFVFGSFARGVRKPNDIDLVIVAEQGANCEAIASELKEQWAKNLESLQKAGYSIRAIELNFCPFYPEGQSQAGALRFDAKSGRFGSGWHFIGDSEKAKYFGSPLDKPAARKKKKARLHAGHQKP